MRRLLFVIAVMLLAITATATAATKRYYWSEEKAEHIMETKVHFNMCDIAKWDGTTLTGAYAERCADPVRRRHVGFWGAYEPTCTGAGELDSTFTFARFRCKFKAGAGGEVYREGSLRLYPTGRNTFRYVITSWYEV